MGSPLVSIVIVNYNGKEYVVRCIEAVFKSSYTNIEIIVVDNDSSDGSIEAIGTLRGDNSNLKLILLDKNYGPAYARNKGVSLSSGEYLIFLDNDTVPDKDWLMSLVKILQEDLTVGACQCKLLLLKEPDKYDYAGDYLSQYGFLIQKVNAREKDNGQFDSNFEILSAKSAAMVIRKNVFSIIGGFDDDYFIYLEETDLGWRTWLAGYRIVFAPDSVVYHEFGTSSIINPGLQNYNAKFHGTKNYISTLIKNLEYKNIIKILPIHIFLWFGMAFIMFFKGKFYESGLVLKGIAWDFINIMKIKNKRFIIQSNRNISDNQLFSKVMKRKKLSYFIDKFMKPQKVGHAKSWGQ